MRFVAKLVLRAYSLFLSPLVHLLAGPGYGCRFQPSCGTYAREAFQQQDWKRASLLTLRRVSRCHPFGGSGYDPVPVVSPHLNNNHRLAGR